jgi:hypothetical protein
VWLSGPKTLRMMSWSAGCALAIITFFGMLSNIFNPVALGLDCYLFVFGCVVSMIEVQTCKCCQKQCHQVPTYSLCAWATHSLLHGTPTAL